MTGSNKHPFRSIMKSRTFVGSAAAVAGAAGLAGVLPESLARAATRSDLSQVKHLVFQMQENSSHRVGQHVGELPQSAGSGARDRKPTRRGRRGGRHRLLHAVPDHVHRGR